MFILSVRANVFSLRKLVKESSKGIINLSESTRTENNEIIISKTLCCADSCKGKIDEINVHVEEISAVREIPAKKKH